jgi:hypothetical protein
MTLSTSLKVIDGFIQKKKNKNCLTFILIFFIKQKIIVICLKDILFRLKNKKKKTPINY